ncbi:N-ethylmaleimide reductase [Microbulbifer donghaiensis]|uniref:N-ethylmaleimide reductase n=1 Tax=Microbulbifer donghaiensis TaxID=494016 RepID=A0A1M4UUX3_9GAMM|nr:alkene reductase [Microbulbifer donghaiensis]SHE60526.1 N-ethylmaleimide reductase [Microbulbifer donghaiensis]
MSDLFTPLKLGAVSVANRVLMAPLTRCRADADHVPTELMAEHYGQRASAGLIIAEATMAMEGASAFWREPGIYSEAQVVGWRKITDAVHAKGGKIFLQIWHGGRACHPLLNDGREPVAPSALPITNDEVHTPEGKKPYTVPRALRDDEIPAIVEGFAIAAENAKRAGFDGVEVHSANGYLLDEFLRDGANRREGPYGGPIENRARLLLEVLDAVCEVWGGDRVGVRLSPLNSFNSMKDSDPVGLVTWLAQRLNDYGLAYLHLMRSDLLDEQQADVISPVRQHYRGKLILNIGYSGEEANAVIAAGQADAIAFGVPFIANQDLPRRLREGADLNEADPSTFYSQGAEGYIDYPSLAELVEA